MNAPPQPARPAERQARDRPRDLAAEDRMNRLAVIMLNHRVVKFALIIVGGFLLGLLLGLMSTTLIFTLLPERMIENGLRDRRGRIEALLKGRPEHCVSGGGLVEHFNPTTNTLDLCICLANGILRRETGRYQACASVELKGYGELGV